MERWMTIKNEIVGAPRDPSTHEEAIYLFYAACKRIAELEERCAFVDSGPGPRELGEHFVAAMDELTARRAYEKDEIAQVLAEHKQRIAELEAQLEHDRWIPLAECLPEKEYENVRLWHRAFGEVWGSYSTDDGEIVWWNDEGNEINAANITHWRQRPKGPERQEVTDG